MEKLSDASNLGLREELTNREDYEDYSHVDDYGRFIKRDVADILIAEFGDEIPRLALSLRPRVIRAAAPVRKSVRRSR